MHTVSLSLGRAVAKYKATLLSPGQRFIMANRCNISGNLISRHIPHRSLLSYLSIGWSCLILALRALRASATFRTFRNLQNTQANKYQTTITRMPMLSKLQRIATSHDHRSFGSHSYLTFGSKSQRERDLHSFPLPASSVSSSFWGCSCLFFNGLMMNLKPGFEKKIHQIHIWWGIFISIRFCQVTKGPSFHQTQKLGSGHLTSRRMVGKWIKNDWIMWPSQSHVYNAYVLYI